MTVEELIELLQDLPEDATILIGHSRDEIYPLQDIICIASTQFPGWNVELISEKQWEKK